MQLICKCGQKFDDKSGWQSGSGLVCGDCYQKSRSHIIMSGFGNQWHAERKPIYQLMSTAVHEGYEGARAIIDTAIRKITDGQVRVGFRKDEDEILNKDNTKRHRKRHK